MFSPLSRPGLAGNAIFVSVVLRPVTWVSPNCWRQAHHSRGIAVRARDNVSKRQPRRPWAPNRQSNVNCRRAEQDRRRPERPPDEAATPAGLIETVRHSGETLPQTFRFNLGIATRLHVITLYDRVLRLQHQGYSRSTLNHGPPHQPLTTPASNAAKVAASGRARG